MPWANRKRAWRWAGQAGVDLVEAHHHAVLVNRSTIVRVEQAPCTWISLLVQHVSQGIPPQQPALGSRSSGLTGAKRPQRPRPRFHSEEMGEQTWKPQL
eukprot:7924457-Pyramimonas_sp.AAC.1